MRRILVVANQTAMEERLVKALAALAVFEPTSVMLVVPATKLLDQQGFGHDEPVGPFGATGAVALARHRLRQAVQRLTELGVDAGGVVGDEDPVKAVGQAMRGQQYDEIIVSTLPRRHSRWLGAGLPEELASTFPIPVTHVEAGNRGDHRLLRRGARRRPASPHLRRH